MRFSRVTVLGIGALSALWITACTAGTGTEASTNEVATINVIFRGVSLKEPPSAKSDLAFVLESELKQCGYFDPTNTALTGQIKVEDTTFTFGATLKLKHPLKL